MSVERKFIEDNVGTHVTVLDLIIRLQNVRRILEFGSGVYSTNKLLEFPNLEQLVSYEDNPGWFKKIAVVKDSKLKLVLDSDLLNIARTIDLDSFDLIFIDCSATPKARAPIVEAVAKRKPKAIVVLHDIDDELNHFPWAIEDFDNRSIHNHRYPGTGILWNQIEGSANIRNVRFEGTQGIIIS